MEVKVLKMKGEATLVEWRDDGNLRRVTIPTTELRGNTVSKATLSMGVEYGAPWASFIPNVSITGEEVERALYNRGIFTADDLLEQPAVARNVLQNLIGDQFAALLRAANGMRKGR